MSDSIILRKSYAFALGIVKVCKELQRDKKEYILSKQLLRAGTSVGANVNEAISAQSKRDFVHKLSIALKEAMETGYWINLLRDSNYLPNNSFAELNKECNEIVKILSSIILTTKQKYFTSENATHNS